MKYSPVIGLEVHIELKTNSKMFCGCSASYFGKKPNSYTCPVCLGLPGALPVPNKKAIEWCVMIGLALNCNINKISKFDRKNYFYPDLSKGYQISQFDLPFGKDGYVTLKKGKKIGITRVHMEEDTAKLTHQTGPQSDNGISLIDFNRSGVPLVEIVTEPDFVDSLEVKEYLQKLQQIIRYLNVSNADMEKGEMRLEPNISLRELKSTDSHIPPISKMELPKYKVEVKNINSFRFVEKAINYELKRQEEILKNKKVPVQETRGWNENKQKTFSQRSKEDAHDYRYFPEPDIPPITFTETQITNIKSQMPELPNAKITRFINMYNLSDYDTEILTREKLIADKFEEIVKAGIPPKQAANSFINKKVDANLDVSTLVAKVKALNVKVIIDEDKLKIVIKEVISENEKAIKEYKAGKTTVIMFLVGQVMKKMGGKADANIIKNILEKKLE